MRASARYMQLLEAGFLASTPGRKAFPFSSTLRALRGEHGQDAFARQVALASVERVTMDVNLIRGLPKEAVREG